MNVYVARLQPLMLSWHAQHYYATWRAFLGDFFRRLEHGQNQYVHGAASHTSTLPFFTANSTRKGRVPIIENHKFLIRALRSRNTLFMNGVRLTYFLNSRTWIENYRRKIFIISKGFLFICVFMGRRTTSKHATEQDCELARTERKKKKFTCQHCWTRQNRDGIKMFFRQASPYDSQRILLASSDWRSWVHFARKLRSVNTRRGWKGEE